MYSIDESLSGQELLDNIVEEVIEIKSSTKVRVIFNAAKKYIGSSMKGIKVGDMNTTSLSMLHLNQKGMYKLCQIQEPEINAFYNNWKIIHIGKSSLHYHSKTETIIEAHYFNYLFYQNLINNRNYPNVLITSDSFFKESEQIDKFLEKYEKYWNRFWLFQIPHHGSDKSSDKKLHARIPFSSINFINFGTTNVHSHPSKSVINDLISTGNSIKMLSITEYNGLRFEFYIQDEKTFNITNLF